MINDEVPNGTYVFEFNEGVKTNTVPPRFTFFEKAETKWNILLHHFSKLRYTRVAGHLVGEVSRIG